MASVVDALRQRLEALGEVVKKADSSTGWFAVYPRRWKHQSLEARRSGRLGPNLIVYRTASGEPRDHYVVPFEVASELLTDDTLTHSSINRAVRWNLTLADGQLHVSHRLGAIDVTGYRGAPLLVEGAASIALAVAPTVRADETVAQGIVEGIEREVKLIARSRSRRLRRLAMERAHGVCEACGNDFGALFGGLGLRVLQVHHEQQLALKAVPAVTSVDDLAVVCANCHGIIHSNPKAALPIDVIRELWATKQRHSA